MPYGRPRSTNDPTEPTISDRRMVSSSALCPATLAPPVPHRTPGALSGRGGAVGGGTAALSGRGGAVGGGTAGCPAGEERSAAAQRAVGGRGNQTTFPAGR